MALLPYDPWTSMTPRPAPQAPDPASLPLTDEPVAGWKPATAKGVRYESRNIGGNVVSRAVEIEVPGTGKPKAAETLYGRYTSVVPGMIAQAKSLAKGGDIAQAKEIIQQVDAFVDGDEDRLMAHMNYQGRERVAAGFAKIAAGSVTRYWHQDPELRDWLNPATNPRVAQYELDTLGVPSDSTLYKDYQAARAGDTSARARIDSLKRTGGTLGAGGRVSAGRAPAAGGPPQDRANDPEFVAKVYGNADTALPELFGEEAYNGMTRDQKMKASWDYTALAEDHPRAPGIISKVMDGARDAAPQAQAALFGQVTDALGQTINLAGEHAADAVTAFDALLGARRNAVGTGFSSVGGDVSQRAVGVAQQVAQARRVGVDVSPASVAAWAVINSGSGPAAEEYKDRAAAVETFLAPHMALTATAPLTMPPDVAGALEAAPVAPAAPADPGFSLLSDEIKTLAGAVAISAVGEPGITAREMKTRLLERAPDVGGLMMKVFGGDVEGADGVKRLMTRDEADQYGYLMLAYIAENPQTNVVDANVAIRKALGVKTAAAAKEEADAKAKTDADAKAATEAAGKGDAAWAATPPAAKLAWAAQRDPMTPRGGESVDQKLYTAYGAARAGARGSAVGEEEMKEAFTALLPVAKTVWGNVSGIESDAAKVLFDAPASTWLPGENSKARVEALKAQAADAAWKELSASPGARATAEALGEEPFKNLMKWWAGAVITNMRERGAPDALWRSESGTLKGVPADKSLREVWAGRELTPFLTGDSGSIQRVLEAVNLTPKSFAAGLGDMARRLSFGVYEDPLKNRMTPETAIAGRLLDVAITGADGKPVTSGWAASMRGYRDKLAERVTTTELARAKAEVRASVPEAGSAPVAAVSPAAPAAPPEDPPFLQIADAAYQAARGERLDKVRALAAGDAVAERIKQRPLTEAARAALYNEDVPAPFVRAGLPPEEVDQSRRQTLERLYTGKIRSEQVPSEYRMLLGARLKTAQKAAAKAQAEAEVVKEQRRREAFVWEQETRAALNGGNVLGTVAPDGGPAGTGRAQ